MGRDHVWDSILKVSDLLWAYDPCSGLSDGPSYVEALPSKLTVFGDGTLGGG